MSLRTYRRLGSILVRVLWGRQHMGCGPAGESLMPREYAMIQPCTKRNCNCIGLEIVRTPSSSATTHQQTSQAATMGTSDFAERSERSCWWRRASSTTGASLVPFPATDTGLHMGIHHDGLHQRHHSGFRPMSAKCDRPEQCSDGM